MGLSKNTLDRSDISTNPIKLKYSATYLSSSAYDAGITLNRGVNTTYNSSSIEFLNYALVRQLYYQEYITGSLLNSANYWDSSLQSTAAEGTFDNDYRYFPTESGARVTILAMPRSVFGENIGRKTLLISGSTYRLVDDGNGNVLDTFTAGSQPSNNDAYGSSGVRLYSPGYSINGTGTNLEWNTAYVGGSYTGTFWTNPVTANKTGRLNDTGLWSAKSLTYLGDFAIQFQITVTAGTYYFGIGCDNFGSVYVDDNLVVSLGIPDGDGTNFRYWHIYPVSLTAGTHTIKYIVTNAGIPSPSNPGAMGIEVYDNTQTQISSSITAQPMGSSTPGGLSVVYSSKDYLSNTIYSQNNHVGNVLYSQGVVIITDVEYQNAMSPVPETTTSTTTTTTTGVPTTSTTTTTTTAVPTTSTTTTTTTGVPTTTTSTTTSTTTAEPTTTTSTTTSTTTAEPTTTTSTTTSTTTAEPTTTTTTSTTTTTTTEETTTTTSTTTTTTTIACSCYSFFNETNQTGTITYKICGGAETSSSLPAGQNAKICIDTSYTPTGTTPSAGDITITPCSSVTTCTTDLECSGCTT
jgi:hypothetical protein